MIQSIQTDILIIGSGAAGIRAAIEASHNRASVIILSSSKTGRANNSAISYGGFSAAVGQDSPERHFEDTMAGGYALNQPSLVRLLSEEVVSEVRNLEAMGVHFTKDANGDYMLAARGGHSVARRLSTASNSGMALINPLLKYMGTLGIKRLEGYRAVRLLMNGECISGVLAIDRKGQWTALSAKSVVLATGGGGALFPATTNVTDALGTGYALAYESGLPLKDMEFVQFVTVFQPEPGLPRRLPPVELFLLKGATLRNSDGQDLIAATGRSTFTRDTITRLTAEESQRSTGENRPVYLDLSTLPSDELKVLEGYGKLNLRVRPAAHFFMGGIDVDSDLKTPIKGLYAAGEVMGGVHGANRLGGNALAEAFVFGAKAGSLAALHAARKPATHAYEPSTAQRVVEELEGFFRVDHQSRNRPLKLTELEEELKKTLEGCAGPVRHLKSLEESLNRIYNLKGVLAGFASPKGSDWWSLIAFKHQVTVAEIILRSAIKREESRGAHFRSDFPDQDDDRWKLNILVQQDQDGGIRLSTRAL